MPANASDIERTPMPGGVTVDGRAAVSPKAQLEPGVVVGPFAVIEDNVTMRPPMRSWGPGRPRWPCGCG